MSVTTHLVNGRAVIPAVLRKQLDMNEGDSLLWGIRNGELVVTTRQG